MQRVQSRFVLMLVLVGGGLLPSVAAAAGWEPPAVMTRAMIVSASKEVLAMPDIPIKTTEDIFRIRVAEMDWDGAGAVIEPEDPAKIPTGPDGKKIGIFMIHGGGGDHREMIKIAQFLSSKWGYKIVTMSYPGSLYLGNASHDWPGRSLHDDGTVRTPNYTKEEVITPDQYEMVENTSVRFKYGTLILACAKEGTQFYARKSTWPMAFEAIGKSLMERHLPANEYSIYIHGHSTGGPFAMMLSQRVGNIQGVIGMDSSPFGYVFRKQARSAGPDENDVTYGDIPWNCMQVRTWRDRARYAGFEALAKEGPNALLRLPMLMEEVLGDEKADQKTPMFKNEGMVHYGATPRLEEAARATAKRLGLSSGDTEVLVRQYIHYSRELSGQGVKPVPNIIFGIAAASADHTPAKYKNVTLPAYRAMVPAPKVRLVEFKAGVHGYTAPETDLPKGTLPAAAKLWHDAIMKGYYMLGPRPAKDPDSQ